MTDEKVKMAVVLGGIVLFLAVCAIITFCSKPVLANELGATQVMEIVWSTMYPSEFKSESFFGKESGGEKRDIGAWIDFESGKAEIFIGSYVSGKGFIGRSGGTFFESNSSKFGYNVYVLRDMRSRIKSKAGSFDALANQTQMNYFDIVRSLFKENLDDFKFSFSEGAGAIKAMPLTPEKGDFAYRLFYLGITNDGTPIISKVEYFSGDGKKVKTRTSDDFRKFEVDGISIWRPETVSIISADGGKTEIKFTDRKFNIDFGKLSKKDLKKGHPPGWRE